MVAWEDAARSLRPTLQRQSILQVFRDQPDRHFSAEAVYRQVRRRLPEIGMATVYRTLALLCEGMVLRKLDFGQGCCCYELQAAAGNHRHLICLDCGKVLEAPGDKPAPAWEENTAEGRFLITDCRQYDYGYCPVCRERRRFASAPPQAGRAAMEAR